MFNETNVIATKHKCGCTLPIVKINMIIQLSLVPEIKPEITVYEFRWIFLNLQQKKNLCKHPFSVPFELMCFSIVMQQVNTAEFCSAYLNKPCSLDVLYLNILVN